ncbi:sarcosine oxidase subunit gamma [Shinella sp. S4-D37]|uniref:sarcosine oxidase subunit gamma n=1 Tax=Shinella sp. S4-D37 TaxID=3161999 RepID=UPI003465F0AC
MPDLKPLTALGGSTARAVTHGVLTLEENSGLALTSLALRRGATEPAPFGLGLPGPGLWTGNDTAAALWTGPGQWLVEGPGRAETDFAAEITAACPGCSVTEQTDGFVAFEVRSAAGEAPVLALMAKLVNLDAARFGPGTATRTGLEHMSVFVIRRAADRLAVIGMRSAAGTLWHTLETAAARLADPGA